MGLPGYSEHIVKKMAHAIKDLEPLGNKVVVDFGAGVGSLAQIWREKYDCSPICIEIDEELIKILHNRSFEVLRNCGELKNKADFIYSSNVLEHIKNDELELKKLRDSLSSNGIMALYVPAFPILFTKLDKEVGHYRRYKKNDLKQKLQNSGFQIIKVSYSDSVGFFVILLMRTIGVVPMNGKASKLSLIFYDKFIHPISRLLDIAGLNKFIGKNIFVVAKLNSDE